VLFDQGKFIERNVLYLTVLMTFGFAFPPLAQSLGLPLLVVSIGYHWRKCGLAPRAMGAVGVEFVSTRTS